MSFTFGFYNSINHDRTYDARQLSSMFDGLITDGVFATFGSAFNVSAGTGMTINVGKGRAWFKHTWSLNDSILVLNIPTAPIAPGTFIWHSVILEVDLNLRRNNIFIISSAISANPPIPALLAEGQDGRYQYRLANISVSYGDVNASQFEMFNRVGSDTPFATSLLDEQVLSTLFMLKTDKNPNINANSTNDTVPGSKAVYDLVANLEASPFITFAYIYPVTNNPGDTEDDGLRIVYTINGDVFATSDLVFHWSEIIAGQPFYLSVDASTKSILYYTEMTPGANIIFKVTCQIDGAGVMYISESEYVSDFLGYMASIPEISPRIDLVEGAIKECEKTLLFGSYEDLVATLNAGQVPVTNLTPGQTLKVSTINAPVLYIREKNDDPVEYIWSTSGGDTKFLADLKIGSEIYPGTRVPGMLHVGRYGISQEGDGAKKVDWVANKGLSTNDFNATYKGWVDLFKDIYNDQGLQTKTDLGRLQKIGASPIPVSLNFLNMSSIDFASMSSHTLAEFFNQTRGVFSVACPNTTKVDSLDDGLWSTQYFGLPGYSYPTTINGGIHKPSESTTPFYVYPSSFNEPKPFMVMVPDVSFKENFPRIQCFDTFDNSSNSFCVGPYSPPDRPYYTEFSGPMAIRSDYDGNTWWLFKSDDVYSEAEMLVRIALYFSPFLVQGEVVDPSGLLIIDNNPDPLFANITCNMRSDVYDFNATMNQPPSLVPVIDPAILSISNIPSIERLDHITIRPTWQLSMTEVEPLYTLTREQLLDPAGFWLSLSPLISSSLPDGVQVMPEYCTLYTSFYYNEVT